MNMRSERHVTIVGAGIVGVCSALWLQRDGWAVTLVDSLPPGRGASFGNAGNISPGAVVPYSIPGSLRQVPGWLFDPTGPLSIRPGYLPRLLPWLFGWVRASRKEEALRISAAMHALHSESFEAYAQLTRGTDAEGLVERIGQLYVSEKPGAAAGSALAQEMRAKAGVAVQVLDANDIQQMEPALAHRFQSGILLPDNGRCRNPHRLVTALAEVSVRNGAQIVQGEVMAIQTEGSRVTRLILDGGSQLTLDALLIAAGAGSGRLLKQFGRSVPIEAERGYHVTLADPGVVLHRPVTHRDWGFAAQPMDMGLRLAGTVEFAGIGAAPNWRRADLLMEQAKRMFPGVQTDQVSRWCGDRPSLPDGLPVLDRMSGVANVFLAFGNSHFGLTAGPVMGRAAAALLNGRATRLPMQHFRLDRFGRVPGLFA
ncbi:FAD-dependent oxidoreductase [Azorhizobium sp. AG788]|uniref:NAD(P)/FAD-dependent oxidoreductase n=1 Tax=Azorhizobium sp. AG788 TaxID=2183897 RepID=UPI003139859A